MPQQPLIAFADEMLGHLFARFAAVVAAMPNDALAWRPGDATTNSVARLMRHVVAGQRLILAIALGEAQVALPDERARGLHDAPAMGGDLLALLAESDAERASMLARLDALDLGEPVTVPWGEPRSRFFWVAHSVGEAREHLGHAELTRQLWELRGKRCGGVGGRRQ